MSRISPFALLAIVVAAPRFLAAQTLYNNGATITITSGTMMRIVGSTFNTAGSTITTAGTLATTGDLTNNGTINGTTGDLVLDGSTLQTLGGAQPTPARDVTVNNAAGITLAMPLQVNGAMSFISGILTATNAAAPVIFTGSGMATGTPASGSVTSNSVTSWSPFTLGSISNNSLLPVKLLAFTGRADGAANRLEWMTATEEEGTTFILERAGASATHFSSLAAVSGRGGGNRSYVFEDEKPLSPLAYYRLQIIAPDGMGSYSQTILLRREEGQAASGLSLYPNPATEQVTIETDNQALHGTTARILDVQGRDLYRFALQPVQTLNVKDWIAGTYLLRLPDGSVYRIVKR